MTLEVINGRVLATAQVPIASFTLFPPHFTFRLAIVTVTKNTGHAGSFLHKAFPPACFNYISEVEEPPVAHYYSASELLLIPAMTDKTCGQGPMLLC